MGFGTFLSPEFLKRNLPLTSPSAVDGPNQAGRAAAALQPGWPPRSFDKGGRPPKLYGRYGVVSEPTESSAGGEEPVFTHLLALSLKFDRRSA
jgi:hypothetical protein